MPPQPTVYRLTLADRAGPWRRVDATAPELYGAVVDLLEDAPADKTLHVQVADEDAGPDLERAESIAAAERAAKRMRAARVDAFDTMEGFRDQAWKDAKRDAEVAAHSPDDDLARSYLGHAREGLSAALYWRDRLRRIRGVAAWEAIHGRRG